MAWRENLHVGNLLVDDMQLSYGGTMGLYKAANGTNVLGTLIAGTTAIHYTNDNVHFKSVFTTAAFTVDTAAAAALALGKKVWTFPAGVILVHGGSFTLTATPTAAALDTDQPYMGIGTVIGSGAVANLTGTAGFDDLVLQDQVNAAFSGAVAKTAIMADVLGVGIPAASAHTVHINIADTWAAQDATLSLAGTFTLMWELIGA